MTDVSTLARTLHDLSSKAAQQNNEQFWGHVQSTSEVLANSLRSRDGSVDNHTVLGQTSLPRSINLLLASALRDAPIPTDKAAATLELIRVSANFCIDNNENRLHLLEANVIQILLSLLEAYNEKVQPCGLRTQLTIFEFKLIRTILGALLNASLDCDEIKCRLNSLEAAQTTLKLVAQIYKPGSWIGVSKDSQQDVEEEWSLRSIVSSWGWRLVSELRNVKDEAVQIFSIDVLPLLIPSLLAFAPPFNFPASYPFTGSPTLAALVESDFNALEDACTLIESLSLDVEDIRIALARGYFFPAEYSGNSYLSAILDFVESGDYPPTWSIPGLIDDSERTRKEKELSICKAALVKAIVEVAGEGKNLEILWEESAVEQPGGRFVSRMVSWIRSYVKQVNDITGQIPRDDLIIVACLSLGNMCRLGSCATTLIAPPYSLTSILVSPPLLSPKTDLKLKHSVLGLLKNLVQSAEPSPAIQDALSRSGMVYKLQESGVWNEKSDRMADIVQLNAIGVVRHLCSIDIEHAFALTIPASNSSSPSGLEQILALVRRTESVPVKSEGTRVLVNVIRSLWAVEAYDSPSQERQRNREIATQLVLTQDSADILAILLVCSGRYPVLSNECILALTLLSMHSYGSQLVLRALSKPAAPDNVASPIEPIATSPTSDISSPTIASPLLSTRTKLNTPRRALDMLVFILRNVDNPANYPQEVRINVCSLLLQLTKHTSECDLMRVREAVRSTLVKLTNRLQSATGKDERLRNSIQKVLFLWN